MSTIREASNDVVYTVGSFYADDPDSHSKESLSEQDLIKHYPYLSDLVLSIREDEWFSLTMVADVYSLKIDKYIPESMDQEREVEWEIPF